MKKYNFSAAKNILLSIGICYCIMTIVTFNPTFFMPQPDLLLGSNMLLRLFYLILVYAMYRIITPSKNDRAGGN